MSWQKHFNQKERLKIIKFLIIGGFTTIAAYALFWTLVTIKLDYSLALIITTLLVITNNYYWSKKWTFQNTEPDSLKKYVSFVFIYLVSASLNLILLKYFVEVLKYDPRIAQIFCQMVVTVINYIGQRYICFNQETIDKSYV